MRRNVCALVTLLGVPFVSLAFADDVTLESVPPVVVKTTPKAGVSDIDPKPSIPGSTSPIRPTQSMRARAGAGKQWPN